MRSSILTLLVAALGLALNAAPAHGESVQITGGKLRPAITNPGQLPSNFKPKAVDIHILHLPAGWSAGVGGCHTVKHAAHPRVEFGFNDGVDNGAKLTAGGYALNDAFGSTTLITLCRDKSGRITKFAAQLAYYKVSGNVIRAYSVSAQNTSPVTGSSSAQTASLYAGHDGSSTTASSKAVNRLQLSR